MSMEFLLSYSIYDQQIEVMLKSFEPGNNIYLFELSHEGFHHLLGIIEEFPSIEYDDNTDEGKLRIVGVDIL